MIIRGKILLITDDVVVGAMMSSTWSKAGQYFTLLESPRMDRPDSDNEVIRVLNVISRIHPTMIVIHNIDQRATEAIRKALPVPILEMKTLGEYGRFRPINVEEWEGLSEEEAIELLLTKRLTVINNSKAVVYSGETGIETVIAANYAIYHQATLQRMKTDESWDKEIISDLNSIENADASVREIMINQLREKVVAQIPDEIKTGIFDKTLIISRGVPLGLGLDPTRKLLHMENLLLGQNLAHNIYEKEWGEHERIAPIGLFVEDREISLASEYESFANAHSRAKGLPKKITTDGHVKLTELQLGSLPYDFLYIATHGKQLEGHKNEYEFITDDGNTHIITANVGSGSLGFVAFKDSVDGVKSESPEWDPEIQGKVYMEFVNRHMLNRVPLPEPMSSIQMQLPMRTLILGNEPGEQSPFSLPRLASNQRAIVVANACGSWTDLIERFSFAGVAAYIGTLWPVQSGVAASFASKFYEELFQKPLDECFFLARESLSSEFERINYVITGSFENKYDSSVPFTSNGYDEVVKRLERLLAISKERISKFDDDTPEDIRNNTEIDEMIFEKELEDLAEAVDEIGRNKTGD